MPVSLASWHVNCLRKIDLSRRFVRDNGDTPSKVGRRDTRPVGNSMKNRISILRTVILALALAGVAGCAEKPEDLVKSAKAYIAKNDPKSAVVQLKNALQKNPLLAEARFLLGSALFDIGDLPAAEKELRKAIELEYPPDKVVPTLVRVMVAAGEHKEALEEFGTASVDSPQGTAELKSALGDAFLLTGNAEAA